MKMWQVRLFFQRVRQVPGRTLCWLTLRHSWYSWTNWTEGLPPGWMYKCRYCWKDGGWGPFEGHGPDQRPEVMKHAESYYIRNPIPTQVEKPPTPFEALKP